MIPGLNPAKMNAMMKQMGISQEEIDSSRVIIERDDGSKIVIDEPSVVKVNMQGQESFQITGNISKVESEEEGFSEEDISMIMEKTGKSIELVKESLEKTGDIAESVVDLSDWFLIIFLMTFCNFGIYKILVVRLWWNHLIFAI